MTKDNPEEDGFFSRWSQRKRAQPAPQAEAVAPAEPPYPGDPPADAEGPLDAPAPITEEELAALPRIEDLTEGSDIRAFLRPGVPRGLKNAAMRRIWMLKPSIRDHVDPAVDYAWDWNTPGGVPGDGVAPSLERAAEMLRDLVRPKAPPLTTPEEPDPSDVAPAPAEAGIATAAEGREPGADPGLASVAEGAESPEDLAQELPSDAPDDAPPRRRHGGALPG